MTAFLNMEVAELPSTHKLCYLGDCNFTRASVAYDYNGDEVPVDTPRFKHRVPDVTVRNLLTGNQSDGGDTLNPELLTLNQRTGTDTLGDTTGFDKAGANTIISSSTEQAHTGTKSLKATTNGDGPNEGIWTTTTTVTPHTTYIAGVWVYAPTGTKMRIALYDGNNNLAYTDFTATGTWQWIEQNITTDTDTTLKIGIRTNGIYKINFYTDDLSLAKNDTTGFNVVNSAVLSVTGETSYQGYRSLKVVTPGSVVGEGVRISTSSLAKVEYTAGCWVKAPLNTPLTFLLSDDGGAEASLNFTGTGNWQYLSNKFTPSYSTSFHIRVKTRTSAQAITFYLDQAMLETTPTSGTASNWAYGGSSYSTYKTEQGCLIEEAHTNLLTANQSTCTDTSGDTTGFVAQGSVPATISSSEEEYIQGSKSLKCVCDGSVYSQGAYVRPTVSIGTTYTISGWIKADKGVSIRIGVSGSTYTVYTGTGDWQFIYHTHTATATAHNYGINTTLATETTFYVDMLQLTATAYPLSWTLGGTTMAAESLTAPSSVLNLNEGTIELEVYVNSTFLIGTHSIIDMRDASGYNRILMRQFINNWNFMTRDGSSSSDITYSQTNTPVNNWYDVTMGYGSILTAHINGNSVGTPVSSPKLPLTYNTLYVGKVFDGSNILDTIVRNITISKTKRTDPDITARAESELPVVDEHCTMIYPLVKDLSAYKVVAK